VFAGGFEGGLNCGFSSGGGSFVSPNGERKRSLAGSLLLPALEGVLEEPAPALGNCADRNAPSASSRFTTTLRVCESGAVPLTSLGDDSSSNAVCRTAVSMRDELAGARGALNLSGFPAAAYPFVFSDVEVELASTVDID
jgi:hypothetical protein